MFKITAFLILLLFSKIILADEASHRAAIERTLELANTADIIDAVYQQVEKSFFSSLGGLELNDEQQKVVEKHKIKLLTVMKEEINFEQMKEPTIELYMSIFTEEEIKELNELYSTPVMQKFMEKMPIIVQASTAFSQQEKGSW